MLNALRREVRRSRYCHSAYQVEARGALRGCERSALEAVSAAPVEAVTAAPVGAVQLSHEGAWHKEAWCGLDRSSYQVEAKIRTGAVFWPIVYIRTFRSPFHSLPFSLHATSCIIATLLCTKLACSLVNLLVVVLSHCS